MDLMKVAQQHVAIDMTPMIDCVFLLMIFFVLIIDLSQQNLEDLVLPRAVYRVPDDQPPKNRPVVNVLQNGSVVYRQRVVYDPAVHGKGYATEAARALVAFAFEDLKLHRVWADADPRNPPSMRVMERLGMRKEAHHVENVCIRDEWCDSVIYAMLRREWETR